MAPLCADPRQVVIALDRAQRQALLRLVEDISSYMISRLETPADQLGCVSPDADDAGEQDDVRGGDDTREQADAQVDDGAQQAAQKPPAQKPPKTQKEPADKAAREAQSIQAAAIEHLQQWRDELLPRLREIANVQDSAAIRAERQARLEQPDKGRGPGADERLAADPHAAQAAASADEADASEDVAQLQALYRPLPTPLTAALAPRARREALSCVLLLALATGAYSAHSRVLVLHLASALALPQAFVNGEEAAIAEQLLAGTAAGGMSAEAEAARRREANRASRLWKVGLASVAGAAVVGVSGGLAAPLVAGALGGILGGVGLGGVASFLSVFWMNGALVGALFGAYGAKMTGGIMDSYAREVDDFCFIPLADGPEESKDGDGEDKDSKDEDSKGVDSKDKDSKDKDKDSKAKDSRVKDSKVKDSKAKDSNDDDSKAKDSNDDDNKDDDSNDDSKDASSPPARRLRVTIGVNGWLRTAADASRPFRGLGPDSEAFALRYEAAALLALGTALGDLAASAAWKALRRELLRRTALATLMAALWPVQALAAAASVDNPFARARSRSRKAGRLLADALAAGVHGRRPVALVGVSLGAAAVHACLRALAERRAFGIVAAVVLVGAPAPADAPHWRAARPVVAGPIFNVYSENDLLLGLVYRLHSLRLGVAGLQPIRGVDGVVNVDLTRCVSGHLRYPDMMGQILRRCGFVTVDAAADSALIEGGQPIQAEDRHPAAASSTAIEGDQLIQAADRPPAQENPLPPEPPAASSAIEAAVSDEAPAPGGGGPDRLS